MNKLIVSNTAPAVSRLHTNNKMYNGDQWPVLPDHDFPERGYSVTVAGVLVLKGQPPVEIDSIGVSQRSTVRFSSVPSRKRPRSNAARRSASSPPCRLSTGCTSAESGIRDAIKRWEGRDRHGRVRQITPTSGSHVTLAPSYLLMLIISASCVYVQVRVTCSSAPAFFTSAPSANGSLQFTTYFKSCSKSTSFQQRFTFRRMAGPTARLDQS